MIKPVNLEALSKWVGHIPDDVVEQMADIAPMLQHFGYDPNANPPKYGEPDSQVIKNTKDVIENEDEWAEREKAVKMERKKRSQN